MPKRTAPRPAPNHDALPPVPPRPIRRQLAMTVRDDHAVLGIGHAGEVLAAVRLSGPDAAAWAVRATEAALQLGVAIDELEAAIRDACKRHRARVRITRRSQVKRVQRAAKIRTGTCQDCEATFEKRGTGYMPTRCEPCRLAYGRRKGREWYRDHAGVPARPGSITCQDCGATVSVQPRGLVPSRCRACRAHVARSTPGAARPTSTRTAVCRDCGDEFRCGSRGVKPGRCPRCLGMLLGS